MLETALTLSAVIVFVLPGFVLVEAARARRGAGADHGDWPLILRAPSYSVLIHVGFSAWTAHVVGDVGHWQHHVTMLSVYSFTVILVAPTIGGFLVGALLDRTDDKYAAGRHPWWYYALGAKDARDAWDFAFQNVSGSYVIVRTDKGLMAGKYSQGSWAGQTPRPHDLYLEEVWTLRRDENGLDVFDEALKPRYSVWLHAETIKDIFFAHETTG